MTSERTFRRRRRSRGLAASLSPTPPNTGAYTQLTVPGNYPFWGFGNEEVSNPKPISYEELDIMMNMDGHARGLYNLLRAPIIHAAKRVQVSEANGGSREADFIKSNLLDPRHLGGTTIPFTKAIGHWTTAFLYGFKAKEKVFDRPNTVVDDGMIRLRKLAPVDSRTVTFKSDDHGGFDGFVQRTNWKGQFHEKTVKRSNAMYYAVNEEEVSFYGRGMFNSAYYHFDKKHKLYYIVHLALAIGAMPPRLGRAQPATSDDARRRFLDALSNLGTNAAMLVPDGFELIDTKMEGARAGLPYREMIDQHNLEMSISILGQFIDIGTGAGGGGGFSLSKNHKDMLDMMTETRMNEIEDLYNNFVIPELIYWNFGTQNYPRLEFQPLTAEIKDATTEIFQKILSARDNNLSPEFLAEIEKEMAHYLDLDVSDIAIETNVHRVLAQKELEFEMERANALVGQDVTNMTASQLLNSRKFRKWAEDFSDRVQERSVLVAGKE